MSGAYARLLASISPPSPASCRILPAQWSTISTIRPLMATSGGSGHMSNGPAIFPACVLGNALHCGCLHISIQNIRIVAPDEQLFTTLPSACATTILLLSVRCNTIFTQVWAAAMAADDRLCHHGVKPFSSAVAGSIPLRDMTTTYEMKMVHSDQEDSLQRILPKLLLGMS